MNVLQHPIDGVVVNAVDRSRGRWQEADAGAAGRGSLLKRVVVVLNADHVPEREVADVAVLDSTRFLSRIVKVHSEVPIDALDVNVVHERCVIRALYVEQRTITAAVLFQACTRLHLETRIAGRVHIGNTIVSGRRHVDHPTYRSEEHTSELQSRQYL